MLDLKHVTKAAMTWNTSHAQSNSPLAKEKQAFTRNVIKIHFIILWELSPEYN